MSKARPTAYQKFYWSDYFGDTYDLDGIQSGAYLHLIGWSWMKGQAPLDDDALLARITKLTMEQWLSVRPALEPFFVIASGLWRHTRIEHDLAEAHKSHEKAVSLATAAANKRWGSAKAEPQPVDAASMPVTSMPTLCQPEPYPEPIKKEKSPAPPSLENEFEDFWAAYSRHDKRREAVKAFPAALQKVGGDPTILVKAAKRYSRQFTHGGKDKQFQAMAASWLNGERWTDPVSVAVTTPEHTLPKQTTIAEDIAAAGALIEENPVSFIPSWFKGS